MNMYSGEIPELPIGTENENKLTKATRIIFAKLSKEEKEGRGGYEEWEEKKQEGEGKGKRR